MSLEECGREEQQVMAIPGISCARLGFVCSGGYDFQSDQYELIDGEDLFKLKMH